MAVLNGSMELSHVATQAHAGAGRSQAEGGRPVARGGVELPEVFKQLEVSGQTYYRWRNQFGGMKVEDVKRLKELEAENVRLKRIVADQVLENQALREVSRGNW
jgi:putative transposase